MVNSGKAAVMMSLSILCIGWVLPAATRGALLTIPEIQYTESADGASPHNGEVIDCAGGVVVVKTAGRHGLPDDNDRNRPAAGRP